LKKPVFPLKNKRAERERQTDAGGDETRSFIYNNNNNNNNNNDNKQRYQQQQTTFIFSQQRSSSKTTYYVTYQVLDDMIQKQKQNTFSCSEIE